MAVARAALPRHRDLQTSGGQGEGEGEGEEFSFLREGNIMWHGAYLQLTESGFVSLESEDCPHRGLLWARLSVPGAGAGAGAGARLFVCTAHLPWSGAESEVRTGVNPRIAAAEKIAAAVLRLRAPGEALVLGGDFNEDFHPLRVLRARLGARDVFEQLDLSPPATHPARPSDPREEMRVSGILHCVALYCIILYCIALHCIVLYFIVLHCIVLHCIALYCIALYRPMVYASCGCAGVLYIIL
jgi:hypothetical protein